MTELDRITEEIQKYLIKLENGTTNIHTLGLLLPALQIQALAMIVDELRDIKGSLNRLTDGP